MQQWEGEKDDTFPSGARINLGEYVSVSALSCSFLPLRNYLCPGYVGVFLLSGPDRSNSGRGSETNIHEAKGEERERGRERLLWSDAEDVCGLILADPGEKGQPRQRFVVSVGYTYDPRLHGGGPAHSPLVSLTNVSGIPWARLLLEGRRHPLTRARHRVARIRDTGTGPT